jgi:uncharacterized membrane protein
VHAHHHHHPRGVDRPIASARAQRILNGMVVGVAVLVAIGLLALWPRGDPPPIDREAFGFGLERLDATVTDIDVDPCSEGIDDLCEHVRFDITSGSAEGEEGLFLRPVVEEAVDLDVGDEIIVDRSNVPGAPPEAQYGFVDFRRQTPLVVLGFLFVVAVLMLGRMQGLRALIALGITVVVLLRFLMPALFHGRPPLLVALVAAGLVALVALYITQGVNERTTVAVLGTLSSLALTGLLGALFIAVCNLTGFASEEARNLTIFGGDVDVRGLLLAGIIIGTLGVLDDVTVTQVSAVWELHLANPQYTFGHLYRSALRIGRDHIGSTVNTLVLAYAGAALPLLLIYSQSGLGAGAVLGAEVVAVEIVRTLVGSIGLVAAVPITTVLAALVVAHPHDDGEDDDASEPDDDGEHDHFRPSWDDFAPTSDAT